ncbi:hypothetical protein VAPA_1c44720 [Variovorax paradoxus B4]|uniref:Uncharacterized protein n=1 Tax=Variovorax paradoxus B4 TaxID=1246301 RepID=T1XHE7_VARPD|nr:hypothetical protein [Variovorax paradoxus]AGU51545.1 hypothetical protein VAPA_1c44720 [Variovorax paradoxus B4]
MTSLPRVTHPKIFAVGEIRIGVITYFPLTDAQAAKIAMLAYRGRKWTKKDQKQVHYQVWIGDRDALALLG